MRGRRRCDGHDTQRSHRITSLSQPGSFVIVPNPPVHAGFRATVGFLSGSGIAFRSACLVALALGVAPAAAPAEKRANYFNDPFLQVTRAIVDCPSQQGPMITEAEARTESAELERLVRDIDDVGAVINELAVKGRQMGIRRSHGSQAQEPRCPIC